MILRILIVCLLVTYTQYGFAGSGVNNPFGGRRVLIIGIDGCRPDALRLACNSGSAPNLAGLIRGGTVTWSAVAGGPPAPSSSNQPTLSGPGWSSILSGVWTDKHQVKDNTFLPNAFPTYPAFMRRVKEVASSAYVASAVSWNPIDSGCIGASQNGSEFMNSRFKGPDSSYLVRDQQVRDQVVSLLSGNNPDVIFSHFDQVDDFGHASGFSKTNAAYMGGISTVDGYIGDILAAMRARPQFKQENWCIIVTTDHGGVGTGHGGQSSDERTIWMIVNGGGAKAGRVSTETPGHTCVPATAMRHLGIALQSAWDIDSTVFGLNSWLDAATAGNRVLLAWSLPGGVPGATAIQVWRDGVLVSSLPLTATNFADTPPAGGGTRQYELRFPGSAQLPLVQSIDLVGDLTSGLVVSLPFDGSTLDVSGRSNHATAVGGTSVFVPGVSGQAIVVNSARYLRLGAVGALLPDLQFGANTDFTIALWVKVSGAWNADPALISNKNWSSGANQGWYVGGQTNASTWQWNLKGASLTRKDFDPSGNSINDGQWHHLAVTHSRTGNAVFYHDGVSIGTVAISAAGSVDTNFPVCIGRDGNAAFAWNVDVAIDDLRIWRRALSGAEAASIVAGVKAYSNWRADNFTPGQLSDSNLTGDLVDADADRLNTLQEFAFNRSPMAPDAQNVLNLSPDAEITYPQRNGGVGTSGVDYTASGLRYNVEHAAVLSPANWQSSTATEIEEGAAPTNNSDGTHTVHLRLRPALLQTASQFLRVRVGLTTDIPSSNLSSSLRKSSSQSAVFREVPLSARPYSRAVVQ